MILFEELSKVRAARSFYFEQLFYASVVLSKLSAYVIIRKCTLLKHESTLNAIRQFLLTGNMYLLAGTLFFRHVPQVSQFKLLSSSGLP